MANVSLLLCMPPTYNIHLLTDEISTYRIMRKTSNEAKIHHFDGGVEREENKKNVRLSKFFLPKLMLHEEIRIVHFDHRKKLSLYPSISTTQCLFFTVKDKTRIMQRHWLAVELFKCICWRHVFSSSSSTSVKQQHQTHSLELKANADENSTSTKKDLCECVSESCYLYSDERAQNRLHQMCIKQVLSSPHFLLIPILLLWASAAAVVLLLRKGKKKYLKVSNHVCLLAFMRWFLLLEHPQRWWGEFYRFSDVSQEIWKKLN